MTLDEQPAVPSPDTLPDWLSRRALTHRGQPALLASPVSWSFGELDARVNVAAARLAALGVSAGDRVALLARNGPAFVVTVHALGRLRAVLVPLNIRLQPVELSWPLGDAGVVLLLHDAEHATLARAALGVRDSERPLDGRRPLRLAQLGLDGPTGSADPDYRPPSLIQLRDCFAIVYTSGTSGRPKGAMLTFGNFWWSAVGSALHLGHHHDDRWLCPLPLFHVGGLSILIRSAVYGIPVVLHDAFDATRVNRAIDTEGVTLVSVVATLLRRLLDERGTRPYPPTLRCLLLGGGPAPRPLLEACAAIGAPVAQSYGLTEAASQVATLLPAEALRKFGSAGLPLPPTDVRIARDGVPAGPGEAGEIIVRGPTVFAGYTGGAEERARAWHSGWLHTGDLGYLDEDGYLFVLDRRNDLIVSGGENVYPAEVEAALLAHPSVADAAVIGVPDDQWGAVPVAYVQRGGPGDVGATELLAYCAARLAAYKVPRAVYWVDALPRNAAGKLMRGRLRTGQP